MPTTRSRKPAPQWLRRHRLQHNAYLAGNPTALDQRTTQRFSREFELALKQRGDEAKEVGTRAIKIVAEFHAVGATIK